MPLGTTPAVVPGRLTATDRRGTEMASDQDFVDFIMDQLSDPCQASFRHMFGGTTLYSKGKVVALICDNQLFVKPTDEGREFIGEVTEAPAYTGAKPSLLIDDRLEDAVWLSQLILITEQALPAPKVRKKKKNRKQVDH